MKFFITLIWIISFFNLPFSSFYFIVIFIIRNVTLCYLNKGRDDFIVIMIIIYTNILLSSLLMNTIRTISVIYIPVFIVNYSGDIRFRKHVVIVHVFDPGDIYAYTYKIVFEVPHMVHSIIKVYSISYKHTSDALICYIGVVLVFIFTTHTSHQVISAVAHLGNMLPQCSMQVFLIPSNSASTSQFNWGVHVNVSLNNLYIFSESTLEKSSLHGLNFQSQQTSPQQKYFYWAYLLPCIQNIDSTSIWHYWFFSQEVYFCLQCHISLFNRHVRILPLLKLTTYMIYHTIFGLIEVRPFNFSNFINNP